MELSEREIGWAQIWESLLLELSKATNILPYYGYAHQGRNLYLALCQKTKDFWKFNEDAFLFVHPESERAGSCLTKGDFKVTLNGNTFDKDNPDEKIMKFIYSGQYKLYSLIINIPADTGRISSLTTFLKTVKLKFITIKEINYLKKWISVKGAKNLRKIYRLLGIEIIRKSIDDEECHLFPPPLSKVNSTFTVNSDGEYHSATVTKFFTEGLGYKEYFPNKITMKYFRKLIRGSEMDEYIKMLPEKNLEIIIPLDSYGTQTAEGILEIICDHHDLIRQALERLTSIDILLTCNNSYDLKKIPDGLMFLEIVRANQNFTQSKFTITNWRVQDSGVIDSRQNIFEAKTGYLQLGGLILKLKDVKIQGCNFIKTKSGVIFELFPNTQAKFTATFVEEEKQREFELDTKEIVLFLQNYYSEADTFTKPVGSSSSVGLLNGDSISLKTIQNGKGNKCQLMIPKDLKDRVALKRTIEVLEVKEEQENEHNICYDFADLNIRSINYEITYFSQKQIEEIKYFLDKQKELSELNLFYIVNPSTNREIEKSYPGKINSIFEKFTLSILDQVVKANNLLSIHLEMKFRRSEYQFSPSFKQKCQDLIHGQVNRSIYIEFKGVHHKPMVIRTINTGEI